MRHWFPISATLLCPGKQPEPSQLPCSDLMTDESRTLHGTWGKLLWRCIAKASGGSSGSGSGSGKLLSPIRMKRYKQYQGIGYDASSLDCGRNGVSYPLSISYSLNNDPAACWLNINPLSSLYLPISPPLLNIFPTRRTCQPCTLVDVFP